MLPVPAAMLVLPVEMVLVLPVVMPAVVMSPMVVNVMMMVGVRAWLLMAGKTLRAQPEPGMRRERPLSEHGPVHQVHTGASAAVRDVGAVAASVTRVRRVRVPSLAPATSRHQGAFLALRMKASRANSASEYS